MAFLALAGGSGGLSGQTSQTSTSGNNDVRAATGNRTYNIGGNPNVQSALQSPWIVAGVVVLVGLWLWRRK